MNPEDICLPLKSAIRKSVKVSLIRTMDPGGQHQYLYEIAVLSRGRVFGMGQTHSEDSAEIAFYRLSAALTRCSFWDSDDAISVQVMDAGSSFNFFERT